MNTFRFCLIGVLLAFCAACSKPDEIETETSDIAEQEAPRTLDNIHPAFHDVKIFVEQDKDILTANFYALTSPANTLARQEFEIARFLSGLREHFPDIRPDVARLSYHGLFEQQRGAIFTIEFDMNRLNYIPDLGSPGIHIFDLSTSLVKQQNEQSRVLITNYCNQAIALDTRVCQIYAHQ